MKTKQLFLYPFHTNSLSVTHWAFKMDLRDSTRENWVIRPPCLAFAREGAWVSPSVLRHSEHSQYFSFLGSLPFLRQPISQAQKNLCPISVCTLNATFTISHSTHTFPPHPLLSPFNGMDDCTACAEVSGATTMQRQMVSVSRGSGRRRKFRFGSQRGWEQLWICLTAISVVETIQKETATTHSFSSGHSSSSTCPWRVYFSLHCIFSMQSLHGNLWW